MSDPKSATEAMIYIKEEARAVQRMREASVPQISIETVKRPGQAVFYRAHIIGVGFDHHGEAPAPSEALLLASARWHECTPAPSAKG